MGLAAINSVLISFAGGGVRKDAYNSADDVSQWPAQFTNEFVASIEFTDSLDGILGNTLLVQLGVSEAEAIAGLAAILVDDRLTIDTSQANCSEGYFAVELGVAGNCGGRTLEDDVIDVSLSALVGPGVTDFVADDNTNLAEFPFIGTAN